MTESKLCVQTINQSWETNYAFLSALPVANKDLETEKLNQYLGKQNKKIFIWQSFVGYRIKAANPVFNPSEIIMMDFNVDQANATQFFYELPLSENEALVEFTRFGTEIIDYDYAINQIENRLKNKNISYQILEIEKGAIPMTPQFDQQNNSLASNQNIIYIGTLGGAIKPTTGYGFKRMFHYAEKLAEALKNEENTNLPTMKRKWRFRIYDIILLQILVDTPHLGKNIFQTLFTNQPITRILKFLDEETSVIEEIKIFSKLPLLTFIKSLFKYIFVR
jgi:lycopene beta-cyclase